MEESKEAFPGLSFASNEPEAEKDIIEYFYLWDCNEKLFEIYKILRAYIDWEYKLPENILLALIKEEELPLKDSLAKIPFIHSGFLDIIVPKGETNGE